jgi:hypothetical protein
LIHNIGRHDVTESTPRTSTSTAADTAALSSELTAWLAAVENAARRRARLEKLILAKGVVRPFTLAQRFYLKSREIGVVATIKIVNARIRQMRPGSGR